MPRVAIVGCGLIGRAWSNVFARAGWDVTIYDAHPGTLERAPALIRDSLHDLAGHGLVSDPAAATARVSAAASLEEAVASADLVQESGPELQAAGCGRAAVGDPCVIFLCNCGVPLH
jgi:L-gulonate 3-dehydrogenase